MALRGSDILKPALSRGELTVIGATTQDEYRNTILKNAALARRFNEVKVNAFCTRYFQYPYGDKKPL
ncbi:MAG: hypothetical protein ACLS8J_07095 [Streptococcus salivarius]